MRARRRLAPGPAADARVGLAGALVAGAGGQELDETRPGGPAPEWSAADGAPIHGARQILRVLGSRPPLHATLVRFTVALTVASLVLDVAARLAGRASPAEAAWWTLAGATGTTVFTLASGLAARVRLPVADGAARSVLRMHMATGPMIFGALVALLLWRAAQWERGSLASWWYVAALAAVTAAVFLQARLGMALVYRFGACVRGRYRPLPYDAHGRPTAGPVEDAGTVPEVRPPAAGVGA